MYFIYSLLLTLGVLLLAPLFLIRRGKYTEGLKQRLGYLPDLALPDRPVIWLHCVSVGETQAARPLARALREAFPQYALVVSTTTRTGQSLAQKAFAGEAAAVFYFPFDWAWCVRRTLNRVKPAAVLIMETELWPNFLRLCRAQDIPVVIVNGRLSAKSVRGYRWIKGFISRVVNGLTAALMHAQEDAERIESLGLAASRIKITGNIKYDLAPAPNERELAEALRKRFALAPGRPLLVAASTHAPEESIALQAFHLLREDAPAARLLIVPRHPERFGEVAALLEKSGLHWARRSAAATPQDRAADVILLDTIGELKAVYSLATVVFIGGSIAANGGHNILEPALARACVVTGPHTFNFASIVNDFLAADALAQLQETPEDGWPGQLAQVWRELLRDEKRREELAANALTVLERNRGATASTINHLAKILRP
jgi:3-deoxy-D-manno-octulosonic-acid transferase